jgi:hypothetical protein
MFALGSQKEEAKAKGRLTRNIIQKSYAKLVIGEFVSGKAPLNLRQTDLRSERTFTDWKF